MKFTKIKLLSALVSVILLSACGSNTSITGSYKDPALAGKELSYKKIFVAALTPDISTRQKVENSIAQSMMSRGYSVVKSIDIFTPDFRSNAGGKSDLVLEKIRGTNSDAILTVSLTNKESESRYVPGSSYPVGTYSYYGSFGGYWGNNYVMMEDPGYYTVDKTYFIETNLYDAKSEKIVWSAQSKTLNPSDIDGFLKEYKEAIGKQLVKDGLIKPKE